MTTQTMTTQTTITNQTLEEEVGFFFNDDEVINQERRFVPSTHAQASIPNKTQNQTPAITSELKDNKDELRSQAFLQMKDPHLISN